MALTSTHCVPVRKCYRSIHIRKAKALGTPKAYVCVCVWVCVSACERKPPSIWHLEVTKNVFFLILHSTAAISTPTQLLHWQHMHTQREPCRELWAAVLESDGCSIDAALWFDKGLLVVTLKRLLLAVRHFWLCYKLLTLCLRFLWWDIVVALVDALL